MAKAKMSVKGLLIPDAEETGTHIGELEVAWKGGYKYTRRHPFRRTTTSIISRLDMDHMRIRDYTPRVELRRKPALKYLVETLIGLDQHEKRNDIRFVLSYMDPENLKAAWSEDNIGVQHALALYGVGLGLRRRKFVVDPEYRVLSEWDRPYSAYFLELASGTDECLSYNGTISIHSVLTDPFDIVDYIRRRARGFRRSPDEIRVRARH